MGMLKASLDAGAKRLVLKGATGTGKTYAMSQLIKQAGKPTLLLAPNKVLAVQLWSELVSFFPNNAVEYFVSYYDCNAEGGPTRSSAAACPRMRAPCSAAVLAPLCRLDALTGGGCSLHLACNRLPPRVVRPSVGCLPAEDSIGQRRH